MASKQERENKKLLKKMNKQRKKQGLPPLDELPTYDLNEPTYEERQQEAEVLESIEVAEPIENIEVIEEDADARFIAEEEKPLEEVKEEPVKKEEEKPLEEKVEEAVKEAQARNDSLTKEELEAIIRKAVQDELKGFEPMEEEDEEEEEEEEVPAVEGSKVETDGQGNQKIHGAAFNGPLVIQSFGGPIPEEYNKKKKKKKKDTK